MMVESSIVSDREESVMKMVKSSLVSKNGFLLVCGGAVLAFASGCGGDGKSAQEKCQAMVEKCVDYAKACGTTLPAGCAGGGYINAGLRWDCSAAVDVTSDYDACLSALAEQQCDGTKLPSACADKGLVVFF